MVTGEACAELAVTGAYVLVIIGGGGVGGELSAGPQKPGAEGFWRCPVVRGKEWGGRT